MLLTVSTVKDTESNLRRFVEGNLRGGVDQMVVFWEGEDSGGHSFLMNHPHVTCIRADDDYWQQKRPAGLNVRQRLNANLAKAALSTFEWADWLFHIDGDEVVHVDRSVLAGVPSDLRAVKLLPREVVSRKRWDEEPTSFKRLLGPQDLGLLATLGVIKQPSNKSLFRGHVTGKSGVRPALDIWLGLHHGIADSGEKLPFFSDETLSVLHYDAYSGEEFVRKWTNLTFSGPVARYRPHREATALALEALLSKGLGDEQLASYLMRLYERTTQDDFETLRDLGLLIEVDPRQGGHEPEQLPPASRSELGSLLDRLALVPKTLFGSRTPASEVRRVLDAV